MPGANFVPSVEEGVKRKGKEEASDRLIFRVEKEKKNGQRKNGRSLYFCSGKKGEAERYSSKVPQKKVKSEQSYSSLLPFSWEVGKGEKGRKEGGKEEALQQWFFLGVVVKVPSFSSFSSPLPYFVAFFSHFILL